MQIRYSGSCADVNGILKDHCNKKCFAEDRIYKEIAQCQNMQLSEGVGEMLAIFYLKTSH